MSTTGSPPIKQAYGSYASHIHSSVEKILPANIKIVQVDDFWTLLGYNSRDFSRVDQLVPNAGIDAMKPMNDKMFSRCLNQLSAYVRTKLGLNASAEIRFFDDPNTVLKDHPTGSVCRPDIVATTQGGDIHWSGIEATVEVHSAERIAESAGIRAASYSILLLQAPPDLLAVQGFCVTKAGIMLTIASSSGVQRTEALDMSVFANRVLLYAFVLRLYEPDPKMVDRSINRRWDATAAEPHYVFDITLTPVDEEPVVCAGYCTMFVRESLDQRAHIFVNEVNPTGFKGVPIPIIKYAYCNQNNCFNEDGIINHIHSKGDVPGVVHVAYAEVVCYEGAAHGVIVRDGCQKTRLCLTESGIRFMDCKTVKEVLIMIYDLLESTRVAHRNCNILHRDISLGNIMFRDLVVPPPSEESAAEHFSDENTDSGDTDDPPAVFCGARYLLGETPDRSFTKSL